MYSEDDKDNDQRFVLGLLAGIVTLLVGSVITFGAYVGSGGGSDAAKAGAAGANGAAATATAAHGAAATDANATTAAATTDAGAAAATGAAGADEAKVVVENGVVKFYFASGKADLAKGGNEALAEVVKGVKAGQKAVISGYHDSTGNLAQNQELAKKRAFSVRDALVALGVPAEQIELKKPEQSAGTGDNAEARRVEVVLTK